MAPGEKPKRREPEYRVYRAEEAPEEEPKRRSLGDLIVRAGAVATAIASIVALVALVWPDSPGKQGAKLSNVSSERDVSLADFAARQQVATLNPIVARGRPADNLQGTGPPRHAVGSLASAGAPPGGAAPTTPDGGSTTPDGGSTTPEQGSTTPEQNGPSQGLQDEEPVPEEGPAPGTPEEKREDKPKKRLEQALKQITPPDYDVNPSCDENDASCPIPQAVFETLVGNSQVQSQLRRGKTGAEPATRSEAVQSAGRFLRVLRSTRVRTSSDSGRQEVLGLTVSFDLQLEGFKGKRSDVRWSLYGARDKRRVPRDWLINRRALSLKGRANTDQASKEFWVPLPRRKGPFFVRVSVYDDKGARLTYEDTKPFP